MPKIQSLFHHLIRFSDELHNAILDSVMHHLGVMPGACFANVHETLFALALGILVLLAVQAVGDVAALI